MFRQFRNKWEFGEGWYGHSWKFWPFPDVLIGKNTNFLENRWCEISISGFSHAMFGYKRQILGRSRQFPGYQLQRRSSANLSLEFSVNSVNFS